MAHSSNQYFSNSVRGVIALWNRKQETPSSLINTMGIDYRHVISQQENRSEFVGHWANHFVDLRKVEDAIHSARE